MGIRKERGAIQPLFSRGEHMFKNKVVLWLLSHGLETTVLDDKRLKVPLRMKDPVWVIDEICKIGGEMYRTKLDNTKSKFELMMLTREIT